MFIKQIDEKTALQLAARGERGSGDGSVWERFRVGGHDAGYSGAPAGGLPVLPAGAGDGGGFGWGGATAGGRRRG